MPTSSPEAVTRHIQKHQQTMRQIAVREHVDLRELRTATKYVGRNIERLNKDVNAGLSAIAEQNARVAGELEDIRFSLDQLVEVTRDGFKITIAYLSKISHQLDQVLEVLNYPARTLGYEQREKGIYLSSKGKPQLAVKSLQKAIELNETDFISLYSLGYIFASNEQHKDAADAFADSALFADPNPALSAQAAILSAHCHKQLGERKKAWAVLRRSLDLNCPDLALPLMQNAHSEAEVEFATKHLANAFVIDAELVLAAEAIDLDFVENAAKIAHKQLQSDISDLKRTWKALSEVGVSSGVFRVTDEPKLPAGINTPQSKLMNAAIYRRRLQAGVTTMKERLDARLAERIPLPAWPRSAHFRGVETGTRIFVAGFVWLAGWLLSFTAPSNAGMAFGGFIIAVLIMSPDIYFALDMIKDEISYIPENTAYQAKVKSIKSQNALFELKRRQVEQVVAETDVVLAETMPPIVPRAFAGDLVAYTQHN